MAAKQIFGPSLPSVELVKYRGQEVEVYGLKLAQLVTLVQKHPSIVGALDPGSSAASFDDAADAMIAMATGVYGDDDQMGYIANMAAGEKASFVSSILRQTAPTGVGPFVELLVGLAPPAGETIEAEKPIKLRSKKSPVPPVNSALPVSAAAM